MAKEVSKTISRGLHKNGGSIREQLIRSSAINETFNQLQLYRGGTEPFPLPIRQEPPNAEEDVYSPAST